MVVNDNLNVVGTYKFFSIRLWIINNKFWSTLALFQCVLNICGRFSCSDFMLKWCIVFLFPAGLRDNQAAGDGLLSPLRLLSCSAHPTFERHYVNAARWLITFVTWQFITSGWTWRMTCVCVCVFSQIFTSWTAGRCQTWPSWWRAVRSSLTAFCWCRLQNGSMSLNYSIRISEHPTL